MTPPLFWVEPDRLATDRIVLDGPEGRHAAAVRRLAPGERLDLSDGRGTRVRCEAVSVDADSVVCRVLDRHVEPVPEPRITVVQALVKGDRGELAAEMLTEAGVDAVVPWQAERCVARWRGDRGAKSLRKWRETVRAAAKQARRARVPEVAEPATRDDVARLLAGAAMGVVLHEEATRRLAEVRPAPRGEIVAVVGPEGGITEAEHAAFTAAGATAVTLGPSILRASTAGVVALAVLRAATDRG